VRRLDACKPLVQLQSRGFRGSESVIQNCRSTPFENSRFLPGKRLRSVPCERLVRSASNPCPMRRASAASHLSITLSADGSGSCFCYVPRRALLTATSLRFHADFRAPLNGNLERKDRNRRCWPNRRFPDRRCRLNRQFHDRGCQLNRQFSDRQCRLNRRSPIRPVRRTLKGRPSNRRPLILHFVMLLPCRLTHFPPPPVFPPLPVSRYALLSSNLRMSHPPILIVAGVFRSQMSRLCIKEKNHVLEFTHITSRRGKKDFTCNPTEHKSTTPFH
jgi:hypothetical protein